MINYNLLKLRNVNYFYKWDIINSSFTKRKKEKIYCIMYESIHTKYIVINFLIIIRLFLSILLLNYFN